MSSLYFIFGNEDVLARKKEQKIDSDTQLLLLIGTLLQDTISCFRIMFQTKYFTIFIATLCNMHLVNYYANPVRIKCVI